MADFPIDIDRAQVGPSTEYMKTDLYTWNNKKPRLAMAREISFRNLARMRVCVCVCVRHGKCVGKFVGRVLLYMVGGGGRGRQNTCHATS